MREFETRFSARVVGEAASKKLSDDFAGALCDMTREEWMSVFCVAIPGAPPNPARFSWSGDFYGVHRSGA